MKSLRDEQGFAHLILLVILVLVLAGAVGYRFFTQTNKPTSTSNSTPAATKALSHPGVIKVETFATSLDANGAPVNPTHTFAATAPNIYVSLQLNNASSSQLVEFVRYFNGKFVDNGSVPVKDGAKYASFVFNVKPGKTHPKGTYVIKTYTNGVFERSATYTVQ